MNPNRIKKKHVAIILVVMALILGCSGFKKQEVPTTLTGIVPHRKGWVVHMTAVSGSQYNWPVPLCKCKVNYRTRKMDVRGIICYEKVRQGDILEIRVENGYLDEGSSIAIIHPTTGQKVVLGKIDSEDFQNHFQRYWKLEAKVPPDEYWDTADGVRFLAENPVEYEQNFDVGTKGRVGRIQQQLIRGMFKSSGNGSAIPFGDSELNNGYSQ